MKVFRILLNRRIIFQSRIYYSIDSNLTDLQELAECLMKFPIEILEQQFHNKKLDTVDMWYFHEHLMNLALHSNISTNRITL